MAVTSQYMATKESGAEDKEITGFLTVIHLKNIRRIGKLYTIGDGR